MSNKVWKFNVTFGAKEIMALLIGIPLVYERVRRVKLKYDKKEADSKVKRSCAGDGAVDRVDSSGYIFGDVIIDSDGVKWRREE